MHTLPLPLTPKRTVSQLSPRVSGFFPAYTSMLPHPITLITNQILSNFNIYTIAQTLKLYLPSLIECTEGRIEILTADFIFLSRSVLYAP